jgi:hypothetical protein
MYRSATGWYSFSLMSAAVLVTGGVSTFFGALSSGVMPLRQAVLEMKRWVGGTLGAGCSITGAAAMLGSVVRATRAVCRPRKAIRASLEALERAMVWSLALSKRVGWLGTETASVLEKH